MVVCQRIIDLFAAAAAADKPRLLQKPELMAHRGLAGAGGLGDLLATLLPAEQYGKNLDPGGITEHFEQLCHFNEFILIQLDFCGIQIQFLFHGHTPLQIFSYELVFISSLYTQIPICQEKSTPSPGAMTC